MKDYYEYKLWLNNEEYGIVTALLGGHMNLDENCPQGRAYGVYDMYFESGTQNSTGYHNELLRMRTYDENATPDSPVNVELVRRVGDIVSKRSLSLPYYQAMEFINCAQQPTVDSREEQRTVREIGEFISYNNVIARAYTSAKRTAFIAKEGGLRVSFDTDLLKRDIDVDLYSGDYGLPVLQEDSYVMTIKHEGDVPLWFEQVLLTLSALKTKRARYARKYANLCAKSAKKRA